jgi:hypothetical protein
MSHKYIARHPATAARKLGGEMVVLSAHDTVLFRLNEQAALIWEKADGITPLREIVDATIRTQYDVPAETAYLDVEELVQELAGRGILLLSSDPID